MEQLSAPQAADPAILRAPEGPRGATSRPLGLLALQRSAGNRAVSRTVQRDDDGSAPADAGAPAASPLADTPPPRTGSTVFSQASTTTNVGGTFDVMAASIAAMPEAGSVTTVVDRAGVKEWTPAAGGDATVVTANLTVTQTTALPAWSPQTPSTDPAVAAKEQAEWTRFQGAISAHEAGHRSIDVSVLGSAHTAALGKKPADADTALDALEAQAVTQNATYDTGNNHGVTGSPSTAINTNFGQNIPVAPSP